MSQKIFANDLVAIRKSKVAFTLYKPVHVGMCMLDLSKLSMYKFHYDYTKSKYGKYSKPLITDTDSLMYDLKTEDINEYFVKDKAMFHFNNYSANSRYSDDSNKLVIGKMKDETTANAIEELV